MADDKRKEADRNFTRGEAANTVLSLSQALLAPLDAILKAQVHAARSFLNFLLQIGFPHQSVVPAGAGSEGGSSPAPPAQDDDQRPHSIDFYQDVPGGRRHKISIPALALVPVAPLGVSSANFQFDFFVREIARHRQIQASEKAETDAERAASAGDPATQIDRNTRPWFLVDTPLSLQGTFAPSRSNSDDEERATDARFSVEVKVAAMPMPAALERLLAGISQTTTTTEEPPRERNDRPTA